MLRKEKRLDRIYQLLLSDSTSFTFSLGLIKKALNGYQGTQLWKAEYFHLNSMMMKVRPFVLAQNFQAMHFHSKLNQWRGSGGESNHSSVDCKGQDRIRFPSLFFKSYSSSKSGNCAFILFGQSLYRAEQQIQYTLCALQNLYTHGL